jgi:hypothetical protein
MILMSCLFRLLAVLKRFGLPIFLIALLGVALVRREAFIEHSTALEKGRKALEELAHADPEAGRVLQNMTDKSAARALRLAAYSATKPKQELRMDELAEELRAGVRLPYRARLAKLGEQRNRGVDMHDTAQREAFLVSYGTALDCLAATAGYQSASALADRLENAAADAKVWPLVFDDPLALMIWDTLRDPILLAFYHENRDWLAESLAALDFSDAALGADALRRVLMQTRSYEPEARAILAPGGDGEKGAGVPGLMVLETHGALIRECTALGLSALEVVGVIFFNPEQFARQSLEKREALGEQPWLAGIKQRAVEMHVISKDHSMVWLAAVETPTALKLYYDAPQHANALLEKYGADDVSLLLYGDFTDPLQINAAAAALHKFGDLAIYVFSRYHQDEQCALVGRYLVDAEIGIRVIPFICAHGDAAFTKLADSKKWIARYYDHNGDPIVDALEWISAIPGGSLATVCRRWANGQPNEWGELGWAAWDVADVAMMVASAGASTTVTTTGKTGVKSAIRATGRFGGRAGELASGMTRLERGQIWKQMAKSGVGAAMRHGRLLRLAREVAATALKGSSHVLRWGGRAVSRTWSTVFDSAKVGGRLLLQKPVLRGLRALSLAVRLLTVTLPRAEEIAQGMGRLVGKAARGAVDFSGQALAAVFRELFAEVSPWLRQTVYWIAMALLGAATVWYCRQAWQGRLPGNRRKLVIQRG